IPFPALKKISSKFEGIGHRLSKSFPYLEIDLKQAEIDLKAKQYCSMMVTITGFYFISATLLTFLVAFRLAPKIALIAAPTGGALIALLIFIQLSFYPKILVKKKVRNIESNLVFALRTILVEIKSSVTLFDSLNIISAGKYSEISREVKKAIDKINTGTMEEEALDEMASNNPSLFFRRAIWQLVNGLKSGADVSAVIASLVESLTNEQKNQVKLYGSALKLLSLVYMMLGVIVPALGLTLLIILSSFPQITIPEIFFWVMLVFLVCAQVMFLGLIKSKRPSLIGE
ncbi:MAG: type II secretion system F family protein, partial [Candidatus Diapherotrites archaeon]|nr:type II secretion system F family protein [Candidatus Diapherotrites archaeon]